MRPHEHILRLPNVKSIPMLFNQIIQSGKGPLVNSADIEYFELNLSSGAPQNGEAQKRGFSRIKRRMAPSGWRRRRPIAHFLLMCCMFFQTHPVASEDYGPVPEVQRTLITWNLVFIQRPDADKRDAALIQVADPARSDLGFVGMMVGCDTSSRMLSSEVRLVVADPFPPHAKPSIAVSGTSSLPFTIEGRVAPSGAAVVFNLDIREKILGLWRAEDDLNVSITSNGASLTGVIPLHGLKDALAHLDAACLANG